MLAARDPAKSRYDRWGAVTAVSTLRRRRRWLLDLVFWFGHQTNVAVKPLLTMRLIALGRWTYLPNSRAPTHLLFETNWSGAGQTYIADLARVMKWQWRSIWGNTKGFPGPLPTARLLSYVDTVDWGTDHFWSNYEHGASTATIVQALRFRKEFEELVDRSRGASADEFLGQWRAFLAEVVPGD